MTDSTNSNNQECLFCKNKITDDETTFDLPLARCVHYSDNMSSTNYNYENVIVKIPICEQCAKLHASIETSFIPWNIFIRFLYWPLAIICGIVSLGAIIGAGEGDYELLIPGIISALILVAITYLKKKVSGNLTQRFEEKLLSNKNTKIFNFNSLLAKAEASEEAKSLLSVEDVYDSFFVNYKKLPQFLRINGKTRFNRRINKIANKSNIDDAKEVIKTRMNLMPSNFSEN